MANTLPTATLGRTGLEVTRLGYGAMELRAMEPSAEVETVLNAVLDAGINYIDTSNDYGRSEEHIGRYISKRRSEYFLATKCGCIPGGGEHIFTRENLFRALEESLERMRTDYIDVMQLHGGTVEQIEDGGIVEVLKEMRSSGKVRWIGTSTRLPSLPTFLDSGAFDEFQIPYSALERDHEDLITKSAKAGIGTVIRGGVAKGEPGVGRGTADRWEKFGDARLDDLREDGEGRSVFMLRLTLSHPDIHTIIAGTKNPAHLRENVDAASRGPLPPETYSEAMRRLSEAGVSAADAAGV